MTSGETESSEVQVGKGFDKPPTTRQDGQLLLSWYEPQRSDPQAVPEQLQAEPHDDPASPQSVEPTIESVMLEQTGTVGDQYGPGHPWHYYRHGDDARPVPFDAIPQSESAGVALLKELPKSPAKRMIVTRALLESERIEIVKAHARYEDVSQNGADALSRYDREIAYGGNDELARAGTLAILYNQISWRLGRIAVLEREQSRGGRGR